MSTLISFFGWTFLPAMVTGWLLTFYYRLITRAGDPIPQRGTPRYVRDYKRIHISAITLYLLYTVYEAYHTITTTPNFYTLLLAPIGTDEKTLKSRFRRLTVLYHPDKVGAAGEGYFLALKQAYDVLLDPVKRFAYDRFGPEVMEWRNCSTMYDYLVRGSATMIPYYVGSLGFLVILSVLGKAEFGRYWRFFTFTSLIILEAALVTRPYTVSLPLLHPLLPFEQLLLARKIVLTTFIAISQLGPMLQSSRASSGPPTAESLRPQLERLAGYTKVADNEASALLATDFVPFEKDPDEVKELQRRMKEWMMEMAVRSNPEVRDAVGKVLQRRREGVAEEEREGVAEEEREGVAEEEREGVVEEEREGVAGEEREGVAGEEREGVAEEERGVVEEERECTCGS